MIFESLTLTDFGVFQGQQRLNLAPRTKYGARRPIILFGGLNGSGKTSILTAIRLALHGRQALGFGTSQKKYETVLARFFHNGNDPHAITTKMSVRLDFTYSNLNGTTRYAVERQWRRKKNGIDEQFALMADGCAVESSDPEQAQVFLTQLVPVGVADLFFFDGEKIAELASEDGGNILAESIERLLGLDVVAKLRTDLEVYERRRGKLSVPDETSAIDAIFDEIDRNKAEVEARYQRIRREIDPAISGVRIDLDKLEGRLAERGGAWAVSRDAFRAKLNELVVKKTELEARVRDMASGILPLAAAPSSTAGLVRQLEDEGQQGYFGNITRALETKRARLEKSLHAAGIGTPADKIIEIVKRVLDGKPQSSVAAVHRLGEIDRNRLLSSLTVELPVMKEEARMLRKQLLSIEGEMAFISGRIAAAPSEEQLTADFEMVKMANQTLGNLLAQKRLLLEEVKSLMWHQIELVRRLKREHAQSQYHAAQKDMADRVTALKGALSIFSERLIIKKTNLFAEQFMQSFRQLVRKEMLISSAKVDPKTLALTLLDSHGTEIHKSQLSAGERQLFAVAMLDALAKTSGRAIPIIIDTPLGRLDSRHRSNLIKHYLPYASHQVVVLSTDTEVDERFFVDLGPSISHAYHLDFEENSRATTAREGYFWRSRTERKGHVA